MHVYQLIQHPKGEYSPLNMKGLQLLMLLVAWSVAVVTAAPPLSTATFPVEDGPEDGPGCSKEQYKQRFGALPTYSLTTATTRPAIQSGFVVAKVSYDSLCPGGGSSFTASIKKQANMEIGTILLVLFYLTIYPHSTLPTPKERHTPFPCTSLPRPAYKCEPYSHGAQL